MGKIWRWPFPDGITDLTDDDLRLADLELRSVRTLWLERKKTLEKSASLAKFSDRLARQFAIESNVIERVFTLDRGTTQVLIEEGISAALISHGTTDRPVQYVVDILNSALTAQNWLFERFVKANDPITPGSIKELHHLLTQHQLTTDGMVERTGARLETPLIHGDWRKQDTQVHKGDTVLNYCPTEQVPPQIERLAELYSAHSARGVAPEILSAWLHHRFVQIHPFQDGNGRVARCLATLVFLKAGLFPVIVTRDEVDKYIGALEDADSGNLKPLVAFVVKGQLKRFNQALDLADDVSKTTETVSLAIQSIADTLKKREEERQKSHLSFLDNLDHLVLACVRRLESTRIELKTAGLESFVDQSGKTTDYYFRGQIVSFAKSHGYYADTSTYRAWARIRFSTDPRTQLIVHFHCRGQEFSGVGLAAGILEIVDAPAGDEAAKRESVDLGKEPFSLYSPETLEQAEERLMLWLEETLSMSLAQVQRLL